MRATRRSVQVLVTALPEKAVLTDEDGLNDYRCDRALDPADILDPGAILT